MAFFVSLRQGTRPDAARCGVLAGIRFGYNARKTGRKEHLPVYGCDDTCRSVTGQDTKTQKYNYANTQEHKYKYTNTSHPPVHGCEDTCRSATEQDSALDQCKR